MDETRSKSHLNAGCGPVALLLMFCVVILPVLYVLSIGPVIWCLRDVPETEWLEAVFGAVYAPLIWIHEQFPTVARWLDAYLEWFE